MYITPFLWRKVIPVTSPPPVEMTHFPPCSPWLRGTFWPCGISPQVYSDYESNPQLRQAIEFACHQFYILHRKPFVLQLFASVAPLLEFPVSKPRRSTKTKQRRKALYSQLVVGRASLSFWQRGGRVKASECSDWRLLALGSCKGWRRSRASMWLVRGAYWS